MDFPRWDSSKHKKKLLSALDNYEFMILKLYYRAKNMATDYFQVWNNKINVT